MYPRSNRMPALSLDTFSDFKFIDKSLSLLNGNDTLFADLLHRIGDSVTDMAITVGRDCRDLGDFLGGGYRSCVLLEERDYDIDGLLDTATQVHWVYTCCDCLEAFRKDCTGEDCGSGGTVSGSFVGLGLAF
jgi:hypothetical protein